MVRQTSRVLRGREVDEYNAYTINSMRCQWYGGFKGAKGMKGYKCAHNTCVPFNFFYLDSLICWVWSVAKAAFPTRLQLTTNPLNYNSTP